MIVRATTGTDLPSLLEIYRPIVEETTISFELAVPSEDEFAERYRSRTGPWLTASIDSVVVGFAHASRFRSRDAYASTRESSVYVHDGHRRTGVAKALMVELIAQLRSEGIHSVIAGIALPNVGSVALHEAVGFSHIGTFHEVGRKFGLWHDVGFWELRVGES